jgi:hypothetical protein
MSRKLGSSGVRTRSSSSAPGMISNAVVGITGTEGGVEGAFSKTDANENRRAPGRDGGGGNGGEETGRLV